MRRFVVFVLLAAAGWLIGFAAFVSSIPDKPPVNLRETDGIVVLTGAGSRLNQAIALLAAGHSGRLLISGVDARTNDPDLKKSLDLKSQTDSELFDCCIDVGREALDTVGNAQEIAAWAGKHGYRSLRVVTSDFHIRRSLLEIRRVAPDLVLVPHPVFSERIRPGLWWRDLASARILSREFNKLLVVWFKVNVYDRIAGAPAAA
ncbi:YdcF family protein [Emcibacter sp. SYSU 3D8]|uniref:YdcF family protein n=1 Tax=Emcibacter sp. SYSU 3D8 TaxID=3133969 RepID=UPI0031FEBCDF